MKGVYLMCWTVSQLAYLAGIIDGEGCINIYRSGKYPRTDYSIRIYVVSTDKILIDWLQTTFGGLQYKRETRSGWKTKYEWIVERRLFDQLCNAVLPYIIIKKAQLELALRFRDSFGPLTHKSNGQIMPLSPQIRAFRYECFVEMRRLNGRYSLVKEPCIG